MDLKSISLEYFGERVIVGLKQDTASYHLLGHEVEGIISGRKWGWKVVYDEVLKGNVTIDTVVSIKISINEQDYEIGSDEVNYIRLEKTG